MQTSGGDSIALVIPTLNESQFIGTLLESVFRQSLSKDLLEVIVVDANSNDDTLDQVRLESQNANWPVCEGGSVGGSGSVTILSNPRKSTPIAFNIGIEAALSDLVVIVGAHSRLDPGFAESTRQALIGESIGAVGGFMTTESSEPRGVPIALAQRSPLGTGGATYRTASGSPIDADTVPFPGFRKSVWESVGRFDEDLKRNQDDEFLQRVRESGFRVISDPNITFTYYARPTFRKLASQYFQYGRYRIVTLKKRGSFGSLRPLAPLILIVGLAGATVVLFVLTRSLIALAPIAGYASILLVEGARLGGLRPGSAFKTALALSVMHFSYGCGEIVGLGEALR